MSPRAPRIGRAEADRLLDGRPAAGDSTDIAAVLAAASAPPLPYERGCEPDDVRHVLAAYRAARGTAPERRRARRSPALTVRVAAVAVLALTGTAVAVAESGTLPGGLQGVAHSMFSGVGVPAPHASPAPAGGTHVSGTPPTTLAPATTAPTSTASRPGAGTTPPAPTTASLVAACRAIEAGTGTSADEALVASVAGKPAKVDGYCARLLRSASDSTATETPAATTGTTGSRPPSRTSAPTMNPAPAQTSTTTHGHGHGRSAAN